VREHAPRVKPPARPAPAAPFPPALRALLLALPALLAVLAYAEVHGFGTVFDDQNALVENEALRAGDPWGATFGRYNSLSNRLLACATFALEFRLGSAPGAMHLVSLLLHALVAVLAGAVVRALLRSPNLRAHWDEPTAAAVGCAAACLWAVHPLGTDAVAYLTQRSMLLMGLFALGAMAALLRSYGSPSSGRWRAAAILGAALALASKEEAAALPLLLMLADRGFGLRTWAAWRARWPFHLGLAATWVVLLLCVLLGPVNPTVGYATVPPITAFEWLLTQTQALRHYAVASFWPADLRGVYDFAVLREVGPAAVTGVLVLGALAATLWAWRRRPWLGFAGAWFFLLLAPTSSIYPIVTEPVADRRMYLPLLAAIVPLAAAARRRLGARGFLLAAALAALALGLTTRQAARIYRDDDAFFAHAATASPLTNGSFMTGRILSGHVLVLRRQGRHPEAAALVERAAQCEAPGPVELLNLANLREEQGRLGEAEALLQKLVRDYPDHGPPKGNLARLLLDRSAQVPEAEAERLLDEAERLLRAAVAQAPRNAETQNTMGVLLHARGRTEQGLPFLLRALELKPDFAVAQRNVGIAHRTLGRPREALAAWEPLLARSPGDPWLREQVAAARAAAGR